MIVTGNCAPETPLRTNMEGVFNHLYALREQSDALLRRISLLAEWAQHNNRPCPTDVKPRAEEVIDTHDEGWLPDRLLQSVAGIRDSLERAAEDLSIVEELHGANPIDLND